MKIKTAIVSMIVLLTIFSTVPVSAKRVSECLPTSLEVWKTITCVTREDNLVTVSGTIYIQNDVTNPTTGELGNIVRYLGVQMRKLEVDVRVCKEATLADVEELKPDAAIIAAGAILQKNTKVGPGEIWGGVPARQVGVKSSSKKPPP